MATYYRQFSETLASLTPEEEAWLRQQLEPIVVIGGTEYKKSDDALKNSDTEPSYQGLRFLRDYEGLDPEYRDELAHDQGFEVEFNVDDTDETWFFAEEQGDPDRLAHLIQKFLKRFRPDQCWSLTYSNSCNKLREGAFSGGAVFVTATEVIHEDSYAFVVRQREAFDEKAARALSAPGIERPILPATTTVRKAALAKEVPAESKTTVVSVSFAFQREYHARITLRMPESFTDDDLVAVLNEINVQGEGELGIFDDNLDDYEWNVPSTFVVLGRETIEGDKAAPEYVATRDGDEWAVEKVAAQ